MIEVEVGLRQEVIESREKDRGRGTSRGRAHQPKGQRLLQVHQSMDPVVLLVEIWMNLTVEKENQKEKPNAGPKINAESPVNQDAKHFRFISKDCSSNS